MLPLKQLIFQAQPIGGFLKAANLFEMTGGRTKRRLYLCSPAGEHKMYDRVISKPSLIFFNKEKIENF